MLRAIHKKYISDQHGFTLLEIAAVLMVSGVVMVAAAQFVKLYNITAKHESTLDHAHKTKAALREFVALEGRYPCPADPTLSPGDANYGEERCRNFAAPAFDPDHCVNTPLNITCHDENNGVFSRDGDNNGTVDVVVEGIIPFRTLYDTIVSTNYRELHKKDGHGQLFSYAVTEHMTNTNLYNTTNPVNPRTGAIQIVDENNINMTVPPSSAHYAVFSHGDNGRGGYTQDGQQVDNCLVSTLPPPAPPSLPAPGPNGGAIDLEIENCDRNDAIYVQGIRSLADNSSYYDDILVYESTGLVPVWKKSLASGADTWLYNTNLENVGIGTDAPTDQLHVAGSLKAEGATLGQQYCPNNSDGDNSTALPADGVHDCLDPDALGGDISQMRCADNQQVAYAIHENKLECRDVDWTPVQGTTCPAGQLMNGFSNLGRIRCCNPDGSGCQILP